MVDPLGGAIANYRGGEMDHNQENMSYCIVLNSRVPCCLLRGYDLTHQLLTSSLGGPAWDFVSYI